MSMIYELEINKLYKLFHFKTNSNCNYKKHVNLYESIISRFNYFSEKIQARVCSSERISWNKETKV